MKNDLALLSLSLCLSHSSFSFALLFLMQCLFASNLIQLGVCLLEEANRNNNIFGVPAVFLAHCRLPSQSLYPSPCTAKRVFFIAVWRGMEG